MGREARTLRRVFIISLIIQFILAPLTSWSGDTPAFVSSALALIYRGSPYATNQFFDPPLGPFLEAPFFALASIWNTPQSLIVTVGAIAPATSVAGVSVSIPSPIALLCLKTPLILATAFSGLCVLYVAERFVGRERAARVAATWLLNPLVIWASAVHGEVDILAAAAVLAFLVAILQRWYLLAGLSLALGIMAKAYPIALLPMGVVALNFHNPHRSEQSAFAPIVRFGVGLGLGLLPFLIFLSNLESIYAGVSVLGGYGGFNLLLLFNSGVFLYGRRLDSRIFTQGNAGVLHTVFAGLFIAALAGSLLLAYLETYAPLSRDRAKPTKGLLYSLVWPAAGVLIYQTSPQSENLVLVLSLVVILTCLTGVFIKSLYWLITAGGLLLYFGLATPAAFFYPLARILGTPWISGINGVVIAYVTNRTFPYQNVWVIAGVTGAVCILSLWALALHQLIREVAARVRPAGRVAEPEVDGI